MNIAELFIRRPVMTTLVMLAILLFGIMAYRQLPVSDLPNVDFPTIQVNASLPGASPETMAAAVATPLERQFSTIAGLDSMSSASYLGSTSITLQLNPADSPVFFLALTSDTMPLYDLDEYGETVMAQRISTVPGVAQVFVYGAQKYAVRIQLDPRQLATRGIGIDEVGNAVKNSNVNLPTGVMQGPYTAYTVQANGQLLKAADYRPLTVAYRNGAPVHLEDLGNVSDSVENNLTAAWFKDKRGLILAIQKQPGTNTVEVADSIRNLLPTFRSELPASVNLDIHRDRAQSIRDSVRDVKFTLLLTLFLVILVIFLFDYSLDNLSLMALTLSVGFVVDDAIVMLENIVRHMELGERPLEAALKGSKEIGFTILSMTISLAAVFIPILFMSGILGRLFHEFAVTITSAILVSGFVSLSLTPLMSAKFLRPHKEQHHGKLYLATERAFDGMLHVYESGLRWVLRNRAITLVFSGLILAATVWLFMIVPKGFIPNEDQGQIFINLEAAQGIGFDELVKKQLVAAAIVMKEPGVATFFSSARSRGANNPGIISIRPTPKSERDVTIDDMIADLRPKLNAIPGLRAYVQNPPPIRLGGRTGNANYQYTMQAADTDVLYPASNQMREKMRKLPDLTDVATDLQMKNPTLQVTVDRDKAAALGLNIQQVEDALFSAYGTRQISTIYAPTNEYQVIMEVDPRFQGQPDELSMLYVRGVSGQLVPLDVVSKRVPTFGPLAVNHSGQVPSVTISFNTKPGVSLGEAVNEINGIAKTTLPSAITTSFQGTAQAFQSSLQGLGLLLLMAIAVIYMVLGILYESFIHPVTILSALPFAGFGALLTLLVFHTELSIYAFVGVIMLVGLVKKNGIMMVDFAVEAQRAGAAPEKAIYDACVVRFRPTMLPASAARMDPGPIEWAFGAGAESRRPLGLAVVGGLLFSQTLTLFVTPVFYLYMEKLRRKPRIEPTATDEELQNLELEPERQIAAV